jgi:hypothetical protein
LEEKIAGVAGNASYVVVETIVSIVVPQKISVMVEVGTIKRYTILKSQVTLHLTAFKRIEDTAVDKQLGAVAGVLRGVIGTYC